MKKSSLCILFMILILVGISVGFAAGFIVNDIIESERVAGIYHSDNWNGKEATLVLNEDGTCRYPNGDTGTWTQEGDNIIITLQISKLTGFPSSTIEEGKETVPRYHTAFLVEDGVILYDNFFEKK